MREYICALKSHSFLYALKSEQHLNQDQHFNVIMARMTCTCSSTHQTIKEKKNQPAKLLENFNVYTHAEE